MLQSYAASSVERLSVAMCTFNGTQFLEAQLRSILAQSLLPYELVVCDDRSTDGTVELLEEFQRTAPFRVRIVRNETTLRPAQNFAQCVALCEGDLVVLTDQDDIWLPDRLKQTRAAFRADARVTVSYADAPLMDQAGKDLRRTIYSSLPMRPEDRRRLDAGGNLLPVLLRHSAMCGATMAFRAELRPFLLPIPELWAHDEWIGLVANALGPAVRSPRPVMRYRQHASQQVGVGDWTLATKLQVVRGRQASFFSLEEQRLRHGLEAVRRHPELCRTLLPLLEDRYRFIQGRARAYTEGLRALPTSVQLLGQGRYARYGSGLRSWVKDCVAMVAGRHDRAHMAA